MYFWDWRNAGKCWAGTSGQSSTAREASSASAGKSCYVLSTQLIPGTWCAFALHGPSMKAGGEDFLILHSNSGIHPASILEPGSWVWGLAVQTIPHTSRVYRSSYILRRTSWTALVHFWPPPAFTASIPGALFYGLESASSHFSHPSFPAGLHCWKHFTSFHSILSRLEGLDKGTPQSWCVCTSSFIYTSLPFYPLDMPFMCSSFQAHFKLNYCSMGPMLTALWPLMVQM